MNIPPPDNASKILFVGQGPNQTAWARGLALGTEFAKRTGDDASVWAARYCARIAVTGAIGTRLGELLDLSVGDFFRRYPRANLNARFNGKSGKGDVFDRKEGERTAAKLVRDPRWTHYVLLGKEVAAAFGIRAEFLETRFSKETEKNFLVFPHPSGISTWWNDDFNRFRARKRLREFVATRDQVSSQ